MRYYKKIIWLIVEMAAALLFLAAAVSCIHHAAATKIETARAVYTDTVYRTDTVIHYQTIFQGVYDLLKDSTNVATEQRGDTVFLTRDRWHTAVKSVIKVDTVYKERAAVNVQSKQAQKEKVQRLELERAPTWIFALVFFLMFAPIVILYALAKWQERKNK